MESQLTTADVYQTASLIGKDMEQIIETFGHSAVMDLMPKVIEVLENLEIAVGEQEKSLLELEEMRLQNERLLTEVKKEASQRRRLDEVFIKSYLFKICFNLCLSILYANFESNYDLGMIV